MGPRPPGTANSAGRILPGCAGGDRARQPDGDDGNEPNGAARDAHAPGDDGSRRALSGLWGRWIHRSTWDAYDENAWHPHVQQPHERDRPDGKDEWYEQSCGRPHGSCSWNCLHEQANWDDHVSGASGLDAQHDRNELPAAPWLQCQLCGQPLHPLWKLPPRPDDTWGAWHVPGAKISLWGNGTWNAKTSQWRIWVTPGCRRSGRAAGGSRGL